MKVACLILSTLLGSALAAPAIVWKSDRDISAAVVHTSQAVTAAELLSDAVQGGSDSSLAAVVFLLGRAEDGSESLTGLASSGSLSSVASKYDAAHSIHHHVSGIESTNTIARDARNGLGENSERRVLEITLSEFNLKLASLTEAAEVEKTLGGSVSKSAKHASKRARALAQADVLIVKVDPSSAASDIDSAVVSAIEHSSVKNVVLAGIRSSSEVKHERSMASRRRLSIMQQAGDSVVNGRRLEANNAQDDDGSSMSGVYYVHMTPNIFAGILFGFFFAVVAITGISCMGMISGGDVFATKLPPIGREA